jgi:CRP-like cAMP-binding protein
MRDIIFLIGMAGAGLADVLDIRPLIIVASSLLFVSAAFALVAPGLGLATLRAASARLRDAEAAPVAGATPLRPATLPDFGRVAVNLPSFSRLSEEQRAAFLRDARIRRVPAGTRVLEHGDVADSAYFILEGRATAGIPEEDGYRGLTTMEPGDFFGEIAALTGSPRTADVVADTDLTLMEVPAEALRGVMTVPEIRKVVLSTLTSRLLRTEATDLPRLAGIDQESLRDLRTPRPSVEALPGSSAGEAS